MSGPHTGSAEILAMLRDSAASLRAELARIEAAIAALS
jgi:hypothetical protein